MTSPRTLSGQWPTFETPYWRGKQRPYCLVIPVLNEGERIGRVLDRLKETRGAELTDILIMDGGSTDGSLSVAALQAAGVAGWLVKTGPGRLSAQLRCAYAFALRQGYEGIITMDGNDKDDPAELHLFTGALDAGVDFAQGSRFIAGGQGINTPREREWAIRLIHAPCLSLASGFHWTDTTQGYRAYSARLLLDPRVAPLRNVFDTYELLAYLNYRAPRLGYRCREVPTTRRYPTGEVPTKIDGWQGKIRLIQILLRACVGGYNPR